MKSTLCASASPGASARMPQQYGMSRGVPRQYGMPTVPQQCGVSSGMTQQSAVPVVTEQQGCVQMSEFQQSMSNVRPMHPVLGQHHGVRANEGLVAEFANQMPHVPQGMPGQSLDSTVRMQDIGRLTPNESPGP